MARRYVLITIVAALLLGLVLGGLLVAATYAPTSTDVTDFYAPVRVVRIQIEPTQREALFGQLRAFADKWSYAVLIDPIDPTPYEDFRIQLWRQDMKLIGIYPTDPGTLAFGFFATDPAVSIPESHFDEEIADLRTYIAQIPGATFSVEN